MTTSSKVVQEFAEENLGVNLIRFTRIFRERTVVLECPPDPTSLLDERMREPLRHRPLHASPSEMSHDDQRLAGRPFHIQLRDLPCRPVVFRGVRVHPASRICTLRTPFWKQARPQPSLWPRSSVAPIGHMPRVARSANSSNKS